MSSVVYILVYLYKYIYISNVATTAGE